MNKALGFAVCCNDSGDIVEVIRNSPELNLSVEVGVPFSRLAARGSLAKVLSFLWEVRSKGAAFDWELGLTSGDDVCLLFFVGGIIGENILIVGSQAGNISRALFEEIILINNQQTDILRDALKEKAVSSELYEEVTRLNNEMANLQRELAKKNTELERLYFQARSDANMDQLTGVYNRRGLIELGEREIQRVIRYQSQISMIMYDLDYFKMLNDTYGHTIGDLVLKETAERCNRSLRKVDIMCRYGGEEFAILLPETSQEYARQVAERLRKLIQQPINTEMGKIKVTASFGVAGSSGDDISIDELLRDADTALYQAKETGRNCVRVVNH